MLNPLPDRRTLRRLLSERADEPHRAGEIDAEIRRRFEREVAILALDLCGFSRLTARHGILFYLAMIHQMHAAAIPAIADNRGTLIKSSADDIFAIFPSPRHALEGALDVLRAFAAVSEAVESDRDIHGSIGIGFGPTLVLDGDRPGQADCFGEEMNWACKLGEDLAGRDEVLLTASAARGLPAGAYALEGVTFVIHGEPLAAWRYVGRLVPEAGEEDPAARI